MINMWNIFKTLNIRHGGWWFMRTADRWNKCIMAQACNAFLSWENRAEILRKPKQPYFRGDSNKEVKEAQSENLRNLQSALSIHKALISTHVWKVLHATQSHEGITGDSTAIACPQNQRQWLFLGGRCKTPWFLGHCLEHTDTKR